MLTDQDVNVLYSIAQAAIERCHWPSLRERLEEVASVEDLDRVWMQAATVAGYTPAPLMED